ncbi:hypothetical protein [Streptomyces sp. WAC00303]|uniref:hypothetical protein n=1 Tax=Streptomyces TaxID=1883 RepID=UPI0024A6983F|nr:hypothetical protein [Streptomyces sp. WAC00303]
MTAGAGAASRVLSAARWVFHHSLSRAVRDQKVRKAQRVVSPWPTAHRTRRRCPATERAVRAVEMACCP